MLFDMISLFEIKKVFRTFFTVLPPAGSCTDTYSFDFFFIKEFQSIFSQIKSICISVVRISFENTFCFSVFLLKILFSFISLPCFSFRKLNCVCSYIVFQPVPRQSDKSLRSSANQISHFRVPLSLSFKASLSAKFLL